MQTRTMTIFTIMVAAMALVATPACALINIPPDSIAGVANGVEELENLFQAITLSSFRTEEGQLNLLDVLADPEAELTVWIVIDGDASRLSDCVVHTCVHRFDSRVMYMRTSLTYF